MVTEKRLQEHQGPAKLLFSDGGEEQLLWSARRDARLPYIWAARHLMVPLLPPVHVAKKENNTRCKNMSFALNGRGFTLDLGEIKKRERDYTDVVRF